MGHQLLKLNGIPDIARFMWDLVYYGYQLYTGSPLEPIYIQRQRHVCDVTATSLGMAHKVIPQQQQN